MERTLVLIVLMVDDTFPTLPQAAWFEPDSCAVAGTGCNGLTQPPAFSTVAAFSISRRRVAKLIVPLALEGGQT
jgi:hypothetical protein